MWFQITHWGYIWILEDVAVCTTSADAHECGRPSSVLRQGVATVSKGCSDVRRNPTRGDGSHLRGDAVLFVVGNGCRTVAGLVEVVRGDEGPRAGALVDLVSRQDVLLLVDVAEVEVLFPLLAIGCAFPEPGGRLTKKTVVMAPTMAMAPKSQTR